MSKLQVLTKSCRNAWSFFVCGVRCVIAYSTSAESPTINLSPEIPLKCMLSHDCTGLHQDEVTSVWEGLEGHHAVLKSVLEKIATQICCSCRALRVSGTLLNDTGVTTHSRKETVFHICMQAHTAWEPLWSLKGTCVCTALLHTHKYKHVTYQMDTVSAQHITHTQSTGRKLHFHTSVKTHFVKEISKIIISMRERERDNSSKLRER